MDPDELPHPGEGFKTYRPARCRVREFHLYGTDLLMAHVEEIEARDGEAAECDCLVCRVLAKVQPEEVEDVEERFPVRFALERLGDHRLEELLRLPQVPEGFE